MRLADTSQKAQRRSAHLAMLRTAYRAGDIQMLNGLWRLGCRRDLWFRLMERVYPVSNLLDLALELDRRMAHRGVVEAARWLLDTYTPGWQWTIPERTRSSLRSEPVVLYGNHPSLLTPFLVAASTGRDDLRVVSAGFVERLVPSYAKVSFTVEAPLNCWWKQFCCDGFRRMLVTRLLLALHGRVEHADVKRENQLALQAAVGHVRAGGSLMIAPGGGGRREPRWYRGLGVIVAGLRSESASCPACLIPYREEHGLDFLVTDVLKGSLRCTEAFSTRTSHRVCIRFGEPEPLDAHSNLGADPLAVVQRLRQQYRCLFDVEASRLCSVRPRVHG